MTDAAAITAGREAWQRIRAHARMNWQDWLTVARALTIGRTEALKAAGTNRPVGTAYNRAMGAWLRENGFDTISTQERYRALLCLENLTAIETWREGLDEAQRRTLNHPGACWAHFQASKVKQPAPRAHVKASRPKKGSSRAIHWPQDALRRAAAALRESRSADLFVMARVALEAAIRNEADLLALMPAAVIEQPQCSAGKCQQTIAHAAA